MVRFRGSPPPEVPLESPVTHPGPLPAPAPEALEALLARLDAFREHPATLPLHDALYRMLRGSGEGGGPGDADTGRREVLAALTGGHPLEGEVRAALGLSPIARSRDLAQVLASIPDLPAREDPLDALEQHLAAQRERIARLEDSRADLQRVVQRQGLLLSAAVGGAALLLILMALGWGLAPLWLGPVGPSASDVPKQPQSGERAGAAGAQGGHR